MKAFATSKNWGYIFCAFGLAFIALWPLGVIQHVGVLTGGVLLTVFGAIYLFQLSPYLRVEK